MTQETDTRTELDPAKAARDKMVEELLAKNQITRPQTEQAFRAVPRERFTPEGTTLEEAYAPWDAVITKRDAGGSALSSISAPSIQALMIEQADLEEGMRVLEIGSGGCNAALIAEVVGDGEVVSVDIDPEVTDRASALLTAAGYGDRVTVLLVDAEHHLGLGEFDRIIVTVGAWDIPPSWLEQLAPDGILVLPLRMNNITRSIAFRREGDHLVSTSAEVCGFVPMQGDGEHAGRKFFLSDKHGRRIALHFEDGAPDEPGLLAGALTREPIDVWSGVDFPHRTSFADLYLWFAGFMPGFCRVNPEEDHPLSQGPKDSFFPFGVARGDSFAYLAARPNADDTGVEFGARAYGPHAKDTGAALTEHIQDWHRKARDRGEPTFAYWPAGSRMPEPRSNVAVLPKRHGTLTIAWPEEG